MGNSGNGYAACNLYCIFVFSLFRYIFRRNENKIRLLIGIIALVLWQFSIPIIVHTLEPIWNVVVGGAFTLLVVVNIFEGSIGMKCFLQLCLILSGYCLKR